MGSGSSRLAERSEVGPRPAVDASRIYLPAVAIVAAAFTLITLGWSSHWGGTSFASSMADQRVVVIGPLTLGILAVILVVERVRPAQIRPLFARGHRQDALYTVLNATLVVPLVVALSLSFADGRATGPSRGSSCRRVGYAAAMVRHHPDLRRDGRLQLARTPRQPPGPDAVAVPRAAPLPGGHERAHGVPDPSPDPRVLPRRADPGDRARGQWRGDDDVARRLRGLSSRSSTRTRTSGSAHWSGSSSAPTTTASTTGSMAPGRQPRLRARRSGTRSSIGPCSRPRPRSAPTRGCRVGRSSWSRRATDRTTSPRMLGQLWGPFRPLDHRDDDVAAS